jgi:uncharacterized protein (TIGR03083 family)
MAKKDLWTMIAAERRALADDLDGLSAKQWSTPSLCGGWSVRDVVAHMTATAEMKPPAFFPKLIGAGFSLNKLSEKEIARRTKGDPSTTLERFKSRIDSRNHPPGPTETWLGETVVHAEDVRRPLGIAHDYSPEALAAVADAYRKSNLVIGGKKRVSGLKLSATDTGWSAGQGAEVSGPMASLVLAIAGRRAALDDLKGDGVKMLAARM